MVMRELKDLKAGFQSVEGGSLICDISKSNQKHICKAPYVAGESEAHSGRD